MKQILFVIAMKKEATDIAEKLELEKVNENVYRKENISLIITGIGKQQTAINLTRYLENCEIKPDLIINMGYVGSTNSKIGEWVKLGYESEKASLNLPAINDFSELVKDSEESNSVLIWYFASLLRYFFEINPQYKGRAKKCTTVSLNKNILISNLIYYTRLSLNSNFLNDDEALKGFFKQYKGKEIKARSGIYPSL